MNNIVFFLNYYSIGFKTSLASCIESYFSLYLRYSSKFFKHNSIIQ